MPRHLGKVMPDPLVTIVIPHYKGEVLLACLKALFTHTESPARVLVVEDFPGDESLRLARERFPRVEVLSNPRNLGFVRACNRGLSAATSRYVMLLNNDVEVTAGWLEALVAFMETHPEYAACQPKILSSQDRRRFDYSGGAGGMMDRFGYPFCLGRVFDHLEEDLGQYDAPASIFWASGSAVLIRREVLEGVGLLDEVLWAHWEEIDLCWRIQLAGGRIASVPSSVIYHHSGWTLPPDSLKKMYLNHRNSLVVGIKNSSLRRLAWTAPVRLGMEALTVLRGLVRLEWKRPLAVVGALAWIIAHPLPVWRGRRASRRLRRVPYREVEGRMYSGSVVFHHFIRGVRRASDLVGRSPL